MAGLFSEEGDMLIERLKMGMNALAFEIMNDSLDQCPIDTGTLRRSSGIELAEQTGPHEVSVTMGYGYGDDVNPETRRPAAEYAVPVHERVEALHAPPTKAKFLEDPVFEHASQYGPWLAAYMDIGGPMDFPEYPSGGFVYTDPEAPNTDEPGVHIEGRSREE